MHCKDLTILFKALSDETRLRIFYVLSNADLNVNEITEVLDMGQSRISRHLKILSDSGLITYRREGTWIYYGVNNKTESTKLEFQLISYLLEHKNNLSKCQSDIERAEQIIQTRSEKAVNYFNKVAPNWESIQSQIFNPQIYRSQILSYLPFKLKHVLDLGCGPGNIISDLVSKASIVTGIDYSTKMIEEAKKEFAQNKKVKFIQSSLEQVPIAKSSIDAVIASMVLHHISNPPLVIKEAYRILKKNGVLCIVELKKHDKEYMRDKFQDLWLGFEDELLSEWLENVGFQIQNKETLSTDSVFKIITIKAIKKGGL